MARNFDHTIGQYAEVSASPVTTMPITISCWVRFTSKPSSGERIFAFYGDDTSATNYWSFYVNSSGNIVCWARHAGVSFATASDLSDGFWHHCMYRTYWDGAVHRQGFWTDGAAVGNTNTSSGASGSMSAFNKVAVGEARDSTPGAAFSGDVAEYVMAAQQGEIDHAVALHRSVNPRRVFGSNMKFIAPLWGLSSPEPDLSGLGNDLTLTGSPVAVDHAPVAPYTPRWAASMPLIDSSAASTRRVYLDDVLINLSA